MIVPGDQKQLLSEIIFLINFAKTSTHEYNRNSPERL
jgi:hypothetical protein